MNFFIDKLEMYQDHQPHSLYGSKGFWSFDLESGETNQTPSVFTKKYQGSYSSSLQIRSDGLRVSVRGNPSRYGRVDNLFGFYSLDDCVAFYNSILSRLKLPLFTKHVFSHVNFSQHDNTDLIVTSGAIITHIDFTRNHSVGFGNEQAFIKNLSAHTIDRSIPPFLYPNQNTVEWFSKNVQGNGSSRRYLKCYAKACELLQHQKKRLNGAEIAVIEYFIKLIDYCIEQGCVREEHSFKYRWLKDHNLHKYGLFTEQDFEPYLKSIEEIFAKLEKVVDMKYENIAEQLKAQGIVNNSQAANATELYYHKWLAGKYIERTSNYYIHRKRLLQLGIDIAVKLDIHRAPIRLKDLSEISIKPLQKPDWYIDPKPVFSEESHLPKNHLKLVA